MNEQSANQFSELPSNPPIRALEEQIHQIVSLDKAGKHYSRQLSKLKSNNDQFSKLRGDALAQAVPAVAKEAIAQQQFSATACANLGFIIILGTLTRGIQAINHDVLLILNFNY